MSDLFQELGLPEIPPDPKGTIPVNINDGVYLEEPVSCPDHDLRMRLTQSPKGNLYYCCPEWSVTGCSGTIGAHQDGKPLGWPCDAETKKARREAHAVFDQVWKGGAGMSRGQSYAWMARVMHLTADEAHIGKFDKDQCRLLINKVYKHFAFTRPPGWTKAKFPIL